MFRTSSILVILYCFGDRTGASIDTMVLKKNSSEEQPGTWIVKDVPRDLMHRVKIAAAVQRKTLKQLLFDLVEVHLAELEKKGLLPKGK